METVIEEQIAEPQVLQAVVVEDTGDTAISPATEAVPTPVYDNEALKAIVQQALQTAADPTTKVTDAVLDRVMARLQGYIPGNDREFYRKVLGSNNFNSHINSMVATYLAEKNLAGMTADEVARYLNEEGKETADSITEVELHTAARRLATSSFAESFKVKLTDELSLIQQQMVNEKDASALLSTALSDQINDLARNYLQAEAGASVEAVRQRLDRITTREKSVGIIGVKAPIKRVYQENYNRYFVAGLEAYRVIDALRPLYAQLTDHDLLRQLAVPIVGAPTGNWLTFGYASIPFEHVIYLMDSHPSSARPGLWPFNEMTNASTGFIPFLKQAADVISILDALYGTRVFSLANWCAGPIVRHISHGTKLGLHLVSCGVRISVPANKAVQVNGSNFTQIPLQMRFDYNQRHINHE